MFTNLKNQSILACGIVLSMSFTGLQAQNTDYNLESCLEFGLTNHPSIKAAGYDVNFARARANEGISAYLPQINAVGALDHNLKLQATVLPGGIFGPDPAEVRFGTKWIASASVQVDQKIFDLTYIMGYKANKPSVDLNREMLNKVKEDIAFDIATNYQKVLVAKEQIKLLQVSLENLERILKIGELQLKMGVMKQTDFDRIRVQHNNVKSQVFIAESGLDLALNALKMSMGMQADGSLNINDSIQFKYEPQLSTGTFNVSNRLDYNILNRSLWLQNVQLNRARAAYAPTISAYGRYGALGQRDDLGDAFKNFKDFSAVGLKVVVPIFDGLMRNARVKQQKYTVLKEQANFELYKLQFEMQYKNAKFQLERNNTALLNDLENLELAENVFQETTLQYEKGVATLTDLINAETSFNQARNNYLTSVTNTKISELEVEKAKGSLKSFLKYN